MIISLQLIFLIYNIKIVYIWSTLQHKIGTCVDMKLSESLIISYVGIKDPHGQGERELTHQQAIDPPECEMSELDCVLS